MSGCIFALLILPAVMRGQTSNNEAAAPRKATTTPAQGNSGKDTVATAVEKGKWSVKVSKTIPQSFTVKAQVPSSVLPSIRIASELP